MKTSEPQRVGAPFQRERLTGVPLLLLVIFCLSTSTAIAPILGGLTLSCITVIVLYIAKPTPIGYSWIIVFSLVAGVFAVVAFDWLDEVFPFIGGALAVPALILLFRGKFLRITLEKGLDDPRFQVVVITFRNRVVAGMPPDIAMRKSKQTDDPVAAME